MNTMQTALALAEEYGIPVFPCRADKRPYTEQWGCAMNGGAATPMTPLERKAWAEGPQPDHAPAPAAPAVAPAPVKPARRKVSYE